MSKVDGQNDKCLRFDINQNYEEIVDVSIYEAMMNKSEIVKRFDRNFVLCLTCAYKNA